MDSRTAIIAGREREAAAPEAPRPRRLRVLVVDEALPYPPDSGKRLRTWHLLRRLARRHEVSLLCYRDPDEARHAQAMAALEAAGIACHTLPAPSSATGWRLYARLLRNCFSPWPYSVAKHHTRRLEQAVRRLSADGGIEVDLVQVEWTPYAASVRELRPPQLIATHNIEAMIWRRRAEVSRGWPARLYFGWQARKMQRFEAWAFRRARLVTTVSAPDWKLARRWGAARGSVVANGVDVDHFRPRAQAATPDRLLFLGSLDWFANQDAVAYFLREIWPGIRQRRPRATLQIVGRQPSAELRRNCRLHSGVELVGEVADVRPWLAEAAVVIVPLRVGGGSRIKILEALAMDRAVVATGVGAEGLDLEPGIHLLLANAPEEFVRATVELLEAPQRAAEMGRAGGAWVRRHSSWDDCAQALEAAWREAARAEVVA